MVRAGAGEMGAGETAANDAKGDGGAAGAKATAKAPVMTEKRIETMEEEDEVDGGAMDLAQGFLGQFDDSDEDEG